MEVNITIFSLAITIATGLLLGISRMIDTLENHIDQSYTEVQAQHNNKTELTPTEIFTLFRQLAFLENRRNRVKLMNRLLIVGYISGYLFSVAGFLVLLLTQGFNLIQSTDRLLMTIVSYLTLASIIFNLFITLAIVQSCRNGIKEAQIAKS